jgi:hypothetical protein
MGCPVGACSAGLIRARYPLVSVDIILVNTFATPFVEM